MSDTARRLFEGLKAGLGEVASQAGAELSRLGTQGSMELASALFNGHAFVPYGPGQYSQAPAPENHQELEQHHGIER